ncbi:MAG TPA: GTPase [Roseiflexaceae bacterium]|nr:GTPase [Roseiflexaceae bacterium]
MPAQPFSGFDSIALAALQTPGISERWAAVQERLHPLLAAIAEHIREAAQRAYPREWALFEISYKNQRYVNRGTSERAPIEEYHLAIDRPPRGAGIYVVVSGVDQHIYVALQLWGPRKLDLQRVWEEQQAVFRPLVARMTEARFAEPRRSGAERDGGEIAPLWIERYLKSNRASYLLAGFGYRWDDPQIAQAEFAITLAADVLALLPLLEAIMEQAERRQPHAARMLREERASYTPTTLPDAETIVARVRERGLAIPASTVRAYHLALQTRPLVILPGISGTGKTRLTRLYADAVYNIQPGQDNEHYLIVAVQPDWHNARDLLGYYNTITAQFHATPFLRFLLQAAGDPHMPYYVCLDEMNLARPEYYLAPILSALETDDRLIDLGTPAPTVTSVSGEVLQNPMRLPLNVAFTGTVNVDESTFALSDKLLDRANVIELTDVDLPAFRAGYPGPVDETAWATIQQVHAVVTRAGQPFGYRTLAEMLRYLERARGVLAPSDALDQQIKQKILPKLRGDDTPRLRRALTGLLELFLGRPQSTWNRAAEVSADALGQAPFPESAEKVRRMLERLDADGFTDFYS